MIAKQPEPPPGLPSPSTSKSRPIGRRKQAFAVFELLDDLRDQIGAHYSVQLFEFSRERHRLACTDGAHTKVADQSF